MLRLRNLARKLNQFSLHAPALALERLMTTGEVLSYCRHIDINEGNEQLIEITDQKILHAEPHPHVCLGAPYGGYSPYCVRASVLKRLQIAAELLAGERPGCKLHIYDAYRPLAVQAFMVDYEFTKLVQQRGLEKNSLDVLTHKALMAEVLMVWAKPNPGLACPPPHSTGAAVDLTIINEDGAFLEMGSEIDALGEVSLPSYFASASTDPEIKYHSNRELLNRVMSQGGFRRLPHEWWHFSFGDQVWGLLEWLDAPSRSVQAVYGRVETE